ncbi:uncharacterized protein PAC_07360 [Phialocephala subalpina]|uniref:BTB domain-containing protein n=1 Tax=Phialocephala subalpina TaxID=576137 RepID=A0A1L7WXH1_9HELO|nr:uncharacterized protein PAC_07360 [Phialocephala subalpina]
MSDPKILTFADDLGTELIEIHVSKEDKSYIVHKDTLFSQCIYFEKSLKPASGDKRAFIDLKAEDPGTVSLLVSFLYRGSLSTFDKRKPAAASPSPATPASSVFGQSRPAYNHSNSGSSFLSPFSKTRSAGGVQTPGSQTNPITFVTPQSLPGNSLPNVPGIPNALPSFAPKNTMPDAEKELYQKTLVNICILTEKICWPELYNSAIRAYIRGEDMIKRPTPIEHARLVYKYSAFTSKLREMVLDGMSSKGGSPDVDLCMAFARENDKFFRAVCARMGQKRECESVAEALKSGTYNMSEIRMGVGMFALRDTSGPSSTSNSSGPGSPDMKM